MITGIGFPKMYKERGEKRDFLPQFFANLTAYPVTIYLEKGYGEKLGFTEADYLQCNPNIRFAAENDIYSQDLVVIVRSPEFELIQKMKRKSGLLAMLHYETRPRLVNLLRELDIQAFSLDAIVDDRNQRLVVTYEMTALAGMQTAFEELARQSFTDRPVERAMKVAIIGLGNLGVQAGKYAFQLFPNYPFAQNGFKGITVEFLDKESTAFLDTVEAILQETDILVDATKRPDPTQVIISNDLLGKLPEHAIILDLCADPYEVRGSVVQGKAIEGIPHGNLDKYVFTSDDEAAYENIPASVSTRNRRTTISCNAWPGVMAKECMEEYGRKITPFLQLLLAKGYDFDVNAEDYYERALARSMISHFEKNA